MNLHERINDAQRQANNLAIQESNLRAQLEPMAALQHQLSRVVAEKNAFLGMVMALQSLVTDEEQATAEQQIFPDSLPT